MDGIKCPICGNAGIPNYHERNVTCPQCGTDLSIYKDIYEATQTRDLGNAKTDSPPKSGISKLIAIVVTLIACLIVVASLVYYHGYVIPLMEKVDMQSKEIDSLNTSLVEIKARTNFERPNSTATQFVYVIQNNDCPWTIVNKLFGNTPKWKKIAENIAKDNGIWDSEKQSWGEIHPGQKLTINNYK